MATSSGEAELYGIGSGAAESIAILQFLRESELPVAKTITIYTDSTAGKSIATRMGVGKNTKHIQLRYLYVQDLVQHGLLRIAKVDTKNNYADLMTKYLDAPRTTLLASQVGIYMGNTKTYNISALRLDTATTTTTTSVLPQPLATIRSRLPTCPLTYTAAAMKRNLPGRDIPTPDQLPEQALRRQGRGSGASSSSTPIGLPMNEQLTTHTAEMRELATQNRAQSMNLDYTPPATSIPTPAPTSTPWNNEETMRNYYQQDPSSIQALRRIRVLSEQLLGATSSLVAASGPSATEAHSSLLQVQAQAIGDTYIDEFNQLYARVPGVLPKASPTTPVATVLPRPHQLPAPVFVPPTRASPLPERPWLASTRESEVYARRLAVALPTQTRGRI